MKFAILSAAAFLGSAPALANTLLIPARGTGLATITVSVELATDKATQDAHFNAELNAKSLCEGGAIQKQDEFIDQAEISGNQVIVTATANYLCNPG